MNTKTLLIGASVGLLTLGSLSFAAVNAKNVGKNTADFSAVRTAVESNNYASLSDTTKAKITEAQFTEMVQKSAERKAVENAVTSGNYTAFKNAMIAQIPDEAEFQKMVSAQKSRADTQAKIETTVKNNDFAGFKALMEAQKADMATKHPQMGNAPKVLSDDKLQEHFTSLVEYYTANGELPEGKGLGAMGGGKGGKMGGHGPRGGQGK